MNQLQKFQEEYCLKPDGVLGPKTLGMMKSVFGIERKQHLAHFIGQISHESMDFKYKEENLNYGASALLSVFGKYFPDEATARKYARQPEKIANKVYANRMGNGDEASGDGWKYRGRGALQLTGKNNYQVFANKERDMSIFSNPGQVAEKYYFKSALHFFNQNRLWHLCGLVDNESMVQLTKRINGGVNGLQDRITRTNKYYKILCA